MKKLPIIAALAIGVSALFVMAQDQGGPPPSGDRPPGVEAPPGGPGGQQRPRGGFHLLPPRAAQRLNLTADQKKQLADLEADVRGKLQKILTADQWQQLKEMRPPRPGMNGGPDGPGPDGGPPGDGARGQRPPPPD